MARDDDEGRASILVFDRRSLGRRYTIEANPAAFWHTETIFHDEAEEEIRENIVDVASHLIGFISVPKHSRNVRNVSPEVRSRWKREREAEINARVRAIAQ
jgi:hypothetical protein